MAALSARTTTFSCDIARPAARQGPSDIFFTRIKLGR